MLTAYHAGGSNNNRPDRSQGRPKATNSRKPRTSQGENTNQNQQSGSNQRHSRGRNTTSNSNRPAVSRPFGQRNRGPRPPKKKMQQKPETPGIILRGEKETNATRTATARNLSPMKKLRVIPIGGLGEVGMNMTVFEYDNDMIIVDAGGLFPREDMPGVDLVIPDISYVLERRHKLRAILFTHGHEDHVSALPYIYPRLQGVPMYGLPLTATIIEAKFAEHNIQAKVNIVKARDTLKFGDISVDLFTLPHTIPDNVGMGIRTPEGLVVYATDWKFDHTPVWGEPADFVKLKEMSEEGVMLLMSDSTNALVPGYTVSEKVIQMEIEKVFRRHNHGRIIMTAFASNINRVQIAINLSAKYGRKIAVAGRSMENIVSRALKLGYVNAPKDILIDIRKLNSIPDNQVTILATGSQGEEFSALTRMSSGEHRQVKIKKGDLVLISASRIPGNEHRIARTVDNLFRQGAEVIHGGDQDMHTGGHAKQEELKMMLAILKPKFFIPIHGEYRMRKHHGQLAVMTGVEPENIFLGENGSIFEVEKGKAKWNGRAQANYVMVDGLGVGDVGEIVIRDRQAMAEEGIFVVILTVDRRTGKLVSSPDIISRGFVYMKAAEELIRKARQEIKDLFARHNQSSPMDWDYVKRAVRDELGQFLYDYTQRRPMVIPVIIEV